MENLNFIFVELVGFLLIPALVVITYFSYLWCKRLSKGSEIVIPDICTLNSKDNLIYYKYILDFIISHNNDLSFGGFCSLLIFLKGRTIPCSITLKDLKEMNYIAEMRGANMDGQYWFERYDWKIRREILIETIEFTENILKNK